MLPKLLILLTLLIAVSVQAQSRNESLRCGSKLVKAGMSIDDVRGYCGAPSNAREEERPIRSGSRILGSFVAQIWEYSRGGNSPAVLEFHDGVLKTITYPNKR